MSVGPRAVWDTDTQWARLAMKLPGETLASQSTTSGVPFGVPAGVRTFTRLSSRWMRMRRFSHQPSRWVAAGLAAAVVIYGAGRTLTAHRESASVGHTYRTAPGQRATVTLVNGTIAVLAPATTLRVRENSAELIGEALFTVTHHSASPFVVRAGITETRVLGTTFGVRRYASDTVTQVTVAEGRVAVRGGTLPAVVLGNGDFAMTGADGAPRVAHDAERVLATLAFAQGRIVFDGRRLDAAGADLSRWLDLDVRVDGDAGWRPFSATLGQETTTQALDMIAALTQTTYTRTGKVVTFSARTGR